MNTQQEQQLQPMEVLHAVRKGYALATPTQLALVRYCRDFLVLSGGWVPRWALEALTLLEEAGCSGGRVRALFALGHDGVRAELAALVKSGKLAHSLEARQPYQRLRIDLPTEMALTAALQQHRKLCPRCAQRRHCPEEDELHDELDLIFPLERRQLRRA